MPKQFLQPLYQAMNKWSHIWPTEDTEFTQICLQTLRKHSSALTMSQHIAKLQWLWIPEVAQSREASAPLCNFLTKSSPQMSFFPKIFLSYMQFSLVKNSIIMQAYKNGSH